MKLNNIYNFKNPIKHFLDIDRLAYPSDIETFDVDSLCWTEPVKFRLRKDEDKYRTLKMPNILSFVRAYHYYKGMPNFTDIQSIDYKHKRLSANIDTGDFKSGEYDSQLNEDFERLCIYDHLLRLDIKEYYGRIYTHNLKLAENGYKDNVLSGLNLGQTNGLLMGNYLSLYFAESMLHDICKLIEKYINDENINCDFMYFSDDFYFFCNKYDTERLVKCFDKSLEKYEFERNESKKDIFTYEDYNKYNILTRYWKRVVGHCNIEALKDYEKENKHKCIIKHKLAFLNQLIYRMSNLADDKLKRIFINNFFKTKYFRELDLNKFQTKFYDYHQLCFLLKFSPEALLYSADKFAVMNDFDNNKVLTFFATRYSEILKEPFNEEQLYYYYALKQFCFEDIIKDNKNAVLKTDNQVLISYYLKDGYFDEDDISRLKEKTSEQFWFQNYHLILFTPELKNDLENNITKYLIPTNAKKPVKINLFMNFYKDNLNENKELINDIESVKEKIVEYLELRAEETLLDYEEE